MDGPDRDCSFHLWLRFHERSVDGRRPPVASVAPGEGQAVITPQERAADEDLKARLSRVIDERTTRADALKTLDSFRIGGYDIQDPGTFWGQRAVGGGGSPWSEYYLTYHGHYLIMLLRDDGDLHTCVDLRVMARTSPDYELTTGRAEVDGVVDEEVIVLFNKKSWQGNSTTDVTAAFKPDIMAGKIVDVPFRSIRVFREE